MQLICNHKQPFMMGQILLNDAESADDKANIYGRLTVRLCEACFNKIGSALVSMADSQTITMDVDGKVIIDTQVSIDKRGG